MVQGRVCGLELQNRAQIDVGVELKIDQERVFGRDFALDDAVGALLGVVVANQVELFVLLCCERKRLLDQAVGKRVSVFVLLVVNEERAFDLGCQPSFAVRPAFHAALCLAPGKDRPQRYVFALNVIESSSDFVEQVLARAL